MKKTQIKITDRQRADLFEFFEAVRGLARNIEGRKRSQG